MPKAVSQSWYRVSELRPRLAAQARFHRQTYRGRPTWILEDVVNQKFFRLPGGAYRFAGMLDGERTVHEVWETLSYQMGDEAPTQDEVITLLAQLYSGNLLLCDIPPDIQEIFERYRKTRHERLRQFLMNPLFARIPLVDPDRFLARWTPRLRWIFTKTGLMLWVLVLAGGLGVAVSNWSALTTGMVDRLFAAENLLWLYLTFAAVKGVHELGHAFACRVRGGEVHEMGIMFLVFMPVPYVEASSSWAFPRTRDRVLVSAGGIFAELFVAALAAFVWATVEPGLASSIAWNAMFLASVSTVLFNGNPLLRYDGYYILSDLLEIPNLKSRSQDYLYYLIQHHLFGVEGLEPPEGGARERAWFLAYGLSSFFYRIFICVAILLFVASRFFAIGVVFALGAVVTWVCVPLFKASRFLLGDPRLEGSRARALAWTLGGLGGVVLLLAVVPAPWGSRSEGVLFFPDQALLRAGQAGFVEEVLVEPGAPVREGDPLIVCRNPELETDLRVTEMRIREVEARRDRELGRDQVSVGILREQLDMLRERRAHLEERVSELVLRSPVDGLFYVIRGESLPGRYIEEGQTIGQILDPRHVVVRTAVDQQDIALIRERLRRVEVRLAERIEEVLPAEVEREVPMGSERLPAAALGSQGGGRVMVDPRDPSGARAVERHFVLDLRLAAEEVPLHSSTRAHVRFDLGHRPLLLQWGRSLRQLVLRRFDL